MKNVNNAAKAQTVAAETSKKVRTNNAAAVLTSGTALTAKERQVVEKAAEKEEKRVKRVAYSVENTDEAPVTTVNPEQPKASTKKSSLIDKAKNEPEPAPKPAIAPTAQKERKAPKEKSGEKRLSNEAAADKFLAEKADAATILAYYTEVYKAKGVTDEKFIQARTDIYMAIARKHAAGNSKKAA